MLQKIETAIADCYLLKPKKLTDNRGYFIKHFQKEMFNGIGLDFCPTESYFSISHQGVLRGLHFQTPPFEHGKLVTCIQGTVLDVVCDLRMGSPTYGKCASFELGEETHESVFIPAGLAHGFYVTSIQSTLLYNVTTSYAPESDTGIAWDSIPFDWPNQQPIISARDAAFARLDAFKSPFTFK
ncbi:dTDP-4-dehydrorhamnose 3,5-epimerase [Ephemeroptericola cinctiostellae]|uniref:dTDP-4-dehydrorhamnose 3,5-epimerase n=1 Tax=Ephemeroptericola cinctiostellae TaxID=2268024 RepID=A0A345DC28_9BURK|nr:dTDP-4-dehydrorhamnose 3,5-epimerase [Ephemeroptericola cinctiostellae]AXF85916.1 dTDP-4-dehydrorhamnose 3,5-epimerase [Ephemeroptericola cinctiostellae]